MSEDEIRNELLDRMVWNETVGRSARYCVPQAAAWIRDQMAVNKEIIRSLEKQLQNASMNWAKVA